MTYRGLALHSNTMYGQTKIIGSFFPYLTPYYSKSVLAFTHTLPLTENSHLSLMYTSLNIEVLKGTITNRKKFLNFI